MAYLYGVRDAKIALWLADGSYGTLYDLPAVNTVEFNPALTSAQLEGDDSEVESTSKMVAVEGRVVFGDNTTVRPEIMTILLGASNTSSGGKERMKIGASNPNYYGLAFKVVHSDNSGETHFHVYKCRISNFQYRASYNGYVVPEISYRGVTQASDGHALEIVQDQALNTALAMPLTF